MERGPAEERYGTDPIAEGELDEQPTPAGERKAEEQVLDEQEPGGVQAVEERLEDRGLGEEEARRAPAGRPPEGSPE